MNEKDAKKEISDILFNALNQKEKITIEQDKKIKDDIGKVLKEIE